MATVTLPYTNPTTSTQYADDLVAELGAPQTASNDAVVAAWVDAESPTAPGYNGLGTTLALPGSEPVPGNSADVQEYPSLAEGLEAAADMMLGEGPQSTALAPQFVTDLRSGTASEGTLTNDIYNSGWAGSGPDSYDAATVASELKVPSADLSVSLGQILGIGSAIGSDNLGGAVGDIASAGGSSVLAALTPTLYKLLAAAAGGTLIVLGVVEAGKRPAEKLAGAAATVAPLAAA